MSFPAGGRGTTDMPLVEELAVAERQAARATPAPPPEPAEASSWEIQARFAVSLNGRRHKLATRQHNGLAAFFFGGTFWWNAADLATNSGC
eukprot:gene11649-biopygen5639